MRAPPCLRLLKGCLPLLPRPRPRSRPQLQRDGWDDTELHGREHVRKLCRRIYGARGHLADEFRVGDLTCAEELCSGVRVTFCLTFDLI